MSRRADVVVPVYRNVELTRRCIESVLAFGGASLGRLVLVNDRSPEPEMAALLREFRARHRQVRLLENEVNLGFVGSANRGIFVRDGDVVVLNSDAEVTAGWLQELLLALYSDERNAAAVPLSNNGGLSSVPRLDRAIPAESLRGRDLRLEELPPTTELPTAMGFCLLFRGAALDRLGAFDPAFGRGYNEENDWCCRARSTGLRIVRANRALVFHHGSVSFGAERTELERRNARLLWSRYPGFLREAEAFRREPVAALAADHVARVLAAR